MIAILNNNIRLINLYLPNNSLKGFFKNSDKGKEKLESATNSILISHNIYELINKIESKKISFVLL